MQFLEDGVQTVEVSKHAHMKINDCTINQLNISVNHFQCKCMPARARCRRFYTAAKATVR